MGEALKPPFTYFGGKTAVAERIAALLPAHEHYVEPFAGSLAVLLAKQPSQVETASDLDGDLVNFWRVLRDRPDELIQACAFTPHARAEYHAAYESAADDLERARRTWVILSQSRARTLAPQNAGWRYQIAPGRFTSIPGDLRSYVERMTAVARRLSRVTLECLPALELIGTYGASAGVLLYVDPPYLGSVRTRESFGRYRCEMPDEADHEELAAALHGCRATVVFSGYNSPTYSRLYDGWNLACIAADNGNGGSDRARTEVLWSNRPFPVQGSLFDLEAS